MKTKLLIISLMFLAAMMSACQKGPTPGDGPEPGNNPNVQALTVAEFLAEPESDSQVYELVGTISDIANTTYGNFNLTDETGTVYVYGLTASELGYGAKNDNSFAKLGLKNGDRIRIRGYHASFGGQDQVFYAWLVKKLNDSGQDTPGGGDTPGGDTPGGSTSSAVNGSGTLADPYNVAGALKAVENLTWTSNTVYEKTQKVYVKGKISRIQTGGTYTQSGTYGNASFYISDDGSDNDEFFVFRTMYFGGEKYTSGTDIKKGDEVIIYGALMNYKGNTPETVATESCLYSLNGATSGGSGSGTTSGSKISFATNQTEQIWAEDVDGTYGTGFMATTQGIRIGYYKHTCATSPVVPGATHVRIYKNSVFIVKSDNGKRIKKIVIDCAPDAGTTSYCWDMTGLEGCASAKADKSALRVTWTGSSSKIVLHCNNGQVRMEKLTVEFE